MELLKLLSLSVWFISSLISFAIFLACLVAAYLEMENNEFMNGVLFFIVVFVLLALVSGASYAFIVF